MNILRKIWFIANAVLRRGYWFNNCFFPECRKFIYYKNFNTDIINLGSTSSVHAFNYDGLKLKCANFAICRNPLTGDLAILKNYCSFLKKEGSIVIIPLCPFTSLSGSYDYFDDRYYRILYASSIPFYNFIHDLQVEKKWMNPLLYYPLYGPIVDIYRFFFKKNTVGTMSEEKMEIDANNWIRGWMEEFSITSFSNPLSLKNKDSIEDAIGLLRQIISFCQEHNCTPIVVMPPMYKTLANKFTGEMRDILINNIISQTGGACRFINYMDDAQFVNERTLFENSFLMNSKGAKLFTRRLLKDIGVIS